MIIIDRRAILEVTLTVLIFGLIVSNLAPPIVHASSIVKGTLSSEDVLIVSDQEGNVLGTYPSDLYIEYFYTYSYGTNETGKVEYKILDSSWNWVYPLGSPATEVYIPDIDAVLHLKYDVSLDVAAGTRSKTEGNVTVSSAGIVAELDVKIYLEFKKAPSTLGTINIGEYLRKYLFNGQDPIITFTIRAEKYVDGEPAGEVDISEDVVLSLNDLIFNLHTINFYIDKVVRKTYIDEGDLDTGAVLLPLYDIVVCGNVNGSNKVYEVLVSYMNKEITLTIDGDPTPECGTIKDVELVPGANRSITVTIRTGAFTLPINYTQDIEGAIVSINRASGRAVGGSGKWTFVVTVPILVSGYYKNRWGTFTVTGEVSSSLIGKIPCQTLTISSAGAYTLICNATVDYSGSSADILNADYSITLTVQDEFGKLHTFQGKVYMDAVDPSNISELAWEVYSYAMKILFGGVVFVIILMIISMIKESITGFPLVDPVYLRGVLLTILVAILILYVAIPYVYNVYTNLLSHIPVFQRYITPPPASDPKTVFTHLVGYYEQLFQEIERDYQVMYVANVQNIFNSLLVVITFFLVAIAVALALSTPLTPGGSIPFASIGAVMLSIVFTYLSLALMFAPAGAMILVGVAIGRLVVLLVTAVILAIMTLGVFMIAIPSPLSQRLGEDMFGAGVLYFITFPMLAPVAYSLYRYVVETATRTIHQSSIGIPLGIVSIFIPIGPIIDIMIYFMASGAVLLMILFSLAYILHRTGIATGLGEALSGLIWRG